jgi:hypothetical protein
MISTAATSSRFLLKNDRINENDAFVDVIVVAATAAAAAAAAAADAVAVDAALSRRLRRE